MWAHFFWEICLKHKRNLWGQILTLCKAMGILTLADWYRWMQTAWWYWTDSKESILISLPSPSQIWHFSCRHHQKIQCLVTRYPVLGSTLSWEGREVKKMEVGEKTTVLRCSLFCGLQERKELILSIDFFLFLFFFGCVSHHLKY